MFDTIFDLNIWARSKKWYIWEELLNIKKKNQPLSIEILELANQVQYNFTIKDYVMGYLVALLPSVIYKYQRKY